MAAPARNILSAVGLTTDYSGNKVPLSPMFHMRLHTNIYYGYVNLEMVDAYYHPLIVETQMKSVTRRLEKIGSLLSEMDNVILQ